MKPPPVNSGPVSPAPAPAGPRAGSAWKPLFVILFSTAALSFLTCGGALSIRNGSGRLSRFLLYAGLFFLKTFGLTLLAIVIYFFIRLFKKLR